MIREKYDSIFFKLHFFQETRGYNYQTNQYHRCHLYSFKETKIVYFNYSIYSHGLLKTRRKVNQKLSSEY
ncbi:unnamed protein product [Rhizophagus irregularis]|nr:unnamed protein product [Rhizophagus irregularis]CAB5203374.1 unnamed protein product [Rhizophagus irregularis]